MIPTRYPQANAIADQIEAELSKHSQQIHRAGSLRRRRPSVKDIEFVLVPENKRNLFGTICLESAVDDATTAWRLGGRIKEHPRPAWGRKQKRFLVPYAWTPGELPRWDASGDLAITCELFIVPKHSLGYQLAIRTGPADFSRLLVTPRKRGGYLPNDCVANEGRIWQVSLLGERLETPEPIYLPTEEQFFEFLGLRFIPADQRDNYREALR